ncbi:MAG: cell envelope integrity protein TolA [Prolixibacteraceae bacterium]|jgi:colicin import membrane protein|nr:cell envelope integrity protein TolA [Prolixibacteraceae bacterium]MBT6763662.1 cell envelope integrity protein TolA [Prolixibacteraceae bacterium]MBT7000081.1 cell envelope integrity protein TolA [Prolixibacteraceae bacterium]MBT7395095.1 cell envelope integrity protein TolA [Prolixibacteraceae bacterium]
MDYYKKHKRGIVGTIIFHSSILLILILFGFFTPLPLPGDEGILVNFGTSDNGFGDREPSPARRNPAPVEPIQEEEQQFTPPPSSTPPPDTQPEPAEEVAMTQDYEQTAAIEAAEKKKREEDETRQRELEEERIRQQQEANRIRQEELEKIRLQEQAEIERKRQEEAERKAREEEQRKIDEINNRAQGAFGESGTGTGGQGNSDGKSQGATFPGGNQGVPTGDPNAGNYGPGGSGTGDQGSGVSFNLSGRTSKSLPKPKYPGNDEGIVVVKVTVDKYGNVTAAVPGERGTTIMNQQFWNEAKQAALKAKFNIDENAPAFQQGTISYRFVLD